MSLFLGSECADESVFAECAVEAVSECTDEAPAVWLPMHASTATFYFKHYQDLQIERQLLGCQLSGESGDF